MVRANTTGKRDDFLTKLYIKELFKSLNGQIPKQNNKR